MSSTSTPHTPDAATDAAPAYHPAALTFLREGLSATIEQVHGPLSPAFQYLAKYLEDHELGWDDLGGLLDSGKAPARVASAIAMIGGVDKLNRHVRGSDLCWGLRDLALKQWGLLARSVLQRWGVRETLDFGRLVYAAIEAGQMQKQPSDSIDDFKDVYEFKAALDGAFRIQM
ncbi:MAG: hypothetical protein IT449_17450 [Phycisphaerales bacterium]|nr:hypothetical protein [Phycisphaerales bacterium]